MVVEQVLKNGATFLQLREKNATHEQRVEEAKKIKQIAAKYHVPFVVNDDIWAAKEAGADGEMCIRDRSCRCRAGSCHC